MKDLEYYRGREQTYLKHFFLEKYLERVAYIIGYSQPKFVYVDGFSGPWKSADEEFEDTSFRIAIKKLRQVRNGLAPHHRYPNIRCLFIEKDPAAYEELQSAVNDRSGLKVKALRGEFEGLIPEILNFIGNSFSLLFIDPTGWTGFGLRKIEPLLKHKSGEVIVNFMFDQINRFLDDRRSEIAASFEELFGGRAPDTAMLSGPQREKKIIEFYCRQMRNVGQLKYVTSTRILKPVSDRSYFYLVYGTRHLKGLREFRRVEKKAVEEQERVRSVAKQQRRVKRSGQRELYDADVLAGPGSFEDERAEQRRAAAHALHERLLRDRRVKFQDALGQLLEMPLVWESDVQQLIKKMRRDGELEVIGIRPRERTVKDDHILVSTIRI